jgi:hypothetical protein
LRGEKMALTVQEALNLEIFGRCRLLTTGSGLQSNIYWVNILEILDDLSHIEPGEFLITTAHGLQVLNTKRQKEMVELFAERKMAAMAIQTGHYIEKIPASLVNLFSAYNIPLIEIPPDISFKSITRSLMLSLLETEKEDSGEMKPAKGNTQLQRKYKAMLAIWAGLTEGKKPLSYHQDFLNLNIETEREYWVCSLAACDHKRNRPLYPVQTEEHLIEPVGQALFQLLEQRHIPYLVGTAGANLTLLLQPLPESGTGSAIVQYSRRILEELRLLCAQYNLYLGLSNNHFNLENWGKALNQAESALRAAALGLVKQNGFGSYATLGPLKLILAVENTAVLEGQLDETLNPLLEYDQRTGGALVHTLRTYLKYHNIKNASEELYVHRHTMKYRLNQIRKLTGINPEETASVVILSEALAIYDYLKARGLHP